VDDNRELELSAETMRLMVRQALDRIVPFLESLPAQPAADVFAAAELAHSLMEPLPTKAVPFSELLEDLFARVIPKGFNTAGPGYLAYIPGGGLFHSAVADLIADAVNRYVGVWVAAPGLSQLESNVLRWFAEIVGYPAEARGLLTTGGSLANFTAIVTARRNRLPESFLDGVLYASDQVHHSVVKSAMMAGFPEGNIRRIPSDRQFRLDIPALLAAIAADRHKHLKPFLVVASAGTTNTGAVDDLSSLADLSRAEGLWLHVDAAYGGFFMLVDRGRRAMRGLERADSITLDPHKALFLPYGTGSLLVRDGQALRRAHEIKAEYMPPTVDDPELTDFSVYSPELSRAFRGLRVWLPLKMHGIDPFRRYLDEKLDLALYAAEELRRVPAIEIVAEPQLSLAGFRIVPKNCPPDRLDSLNRQLLKAVNARNRVMLTGTVAHGMFIIRICIVSFRTHRDRVDMALEDIRRECSNISG
jgi:aromatic-L-amino-acid decarboxylase